MTSHEEDKQPDSTFVGNTFENYSEGDGALDSFLGCLESQESEPLITYEDLITEEDTSNRAVPYFEKTSKPVSSKPIFQMQSYNPKPFKSKFQHSVIV